MMTRRQAIDAALALAEDSAKRFVPARMKWMWGQALYLYALACLDEADGTGRFTPFIAAYYDAHIQKGYRVESSDTAAPGLAAYRLYAQTGRRKYLNVAHDVAGYMKSEKGVLEGLPNHMGHGPYSRVYPESVWVDSIMMYGVYAALYGRCENDAGLAAQAGRIAPLFGKYLRDDKTGLFYHSYWTKQKTHYPREPIFWGRGNGWVMAAVPMMLAQLPEGPEKEEAAALFTKLSRALLPLQRPDGWFETLLLPAGKSYRESSATALVAAGWYAGVGAGLLGEAYLQGADRAFTAVCGALSRDGAGLHMPHISAPTIPTQVLPYWGYRLTPTGTDLTYGLAALFFAALAAESIDNPPADGRVPNG